MAKKFRSGQKVEFKKKYLDVPKGAVGTFNRYRGDGTGDGGCEVGLLNEHGGPVTYEPDPAILKSTRKRTVTVVSQGSTATTRSRTVAKAKKTKSKKSTRSTAVEGTRAQARHELACRQRGLDGKRLPREKRKKCSRGARPLRDQLNAKLVSMAK